MLYFAYGANMDPRHMAEHAPNAIHLGRAVLDGHAFGIAAGGFGTVRPVPGRTVHGVLWRLTPADAAALDRFEGVEEQFYRRTTVSVATASGNEAEAMVYRPVDDRPGLAASGYLERILEVATDLGFPPEYRTELATLLSPTAPPA